MFRKTRMTAKRTIPLVSRGASTLGLLPASRLLEKYVAFMQGKGSGVGWDMDAEAVAANRFLNRSDCVVFDVGANKGDWSKALSAIAVTEIQFVLIEPQPECVKLLRELPVRKLIIPCAVGDGNSSATLFHCERKTNLSSLHPRRDSLSDGLVFQGIEVETRTLDSIIQELRLDRVDYLKMDLEGHELFAIRGAEESIRTGIVKTLAFEFGLSNINSRILFKDIWDFLKSFRNQLFRILPGGNLLRITGYHEDLEFFSGASNYVVVFE